MTKDLYSSDSIESLDPLSFTRLRPGVYCGNTEYSTQLVVELFSNALDEHNLGHGNKIKITIEEDNIITVEDEGQGFLVNEMREDGKTVLEASFSVLNTSAKYSEDGVYGSCALGLNGVGSKICVFLSHFTEVKTCRDGEYEHIWFEEGVFSKRELGVCDPDVSGTWVKFQPSEEFFDHPEPNIKELKRMFHEICCLCPKLEVDFNGKIISHSEGLENLVKEKIGSSDLALTSSLLFQEKQDKYELSCGLCYSSGNGTTIVPYVNYGLTDSGPHIVAAKTCLTRTINKWAKEQGILGEKDKNLEGSALQEGMILVFNLVSPGVSYDAQTKSRIVNNDFVSFINEALGKHLEIWLDNNPQDGRVIVEKALLARKAAEAAKKAREAVRAKADKSKADKVFKMPTTLTDCWSKNRKECELLIAEGKSAASGLVASRDSKTQAVYGVRGKMISALKTTPAALMKNQEVNNLVQALGLECDSTTAKMKYDESKLRYGKIIACADADPDGKAIENLLFNILWFMCPELIVNGHVWSAVPPLFRITTKANEYIYCRDEKELQEKKQKIGEKNILSINRNKGLGEQDSEELAECLLEPKTRNIVQLSVDDFGLAEGTFQLLYGKEVAARLQFLNEHLEEANID